MPGDPEKFLNLIHIDDAAGAALAAFAASEPEPLYVVADDRPVTRNEYYSRMAALLGTPAASLRPTLSGKPGGGARGDQQEAFQPPHQSRAGPLSIYPDITTGLAAALERHA